MKSIGLSGKPANTIKPKDVYSQCLRHNLKSDRVAIIIQSYSNQSDYIKRLQEIDKCILGNTTTEKIAVLDILDSKGLEFDIVYVDSSHMDINEKYIAYTRALRLLYIITN